MINDHGEATGGIVEFRKFAEVQSAVHRLWPALEAKTELVIKLVRKMNKWEFHHILIDCVHQHACSFNKEDQPSPFELYQSYVALSEGLLARNHTIKSILGAGMVINSDTTILLAGSRTPY